MSTNLGKAKKVDSPFMRFIPVSANMPISPNQQQSKVSFNTAQNPMLISRDQGHAFGSTGASFQPQVQPSMGQQFNLEAHKLDQLHHPANTPGRNNSSLRLQSSHFSFAGQSGNRGSPFAGLSPMMQHKSPIKCNIMNENHVLDKYGSPNHVNRLFNHSASKKGLSVESPSNMDPINNVLS